MIHPPDVIPNYTPNAIIGSLKGGPAAFRARSPFRHRECRLTAWRRLPSQVQDGLLGCGRETGVERGTRPLGPPWRTFGHSGLCRQGRN